MNILIAADDTFFKSTIFYRTYLNFYRQIIAEYTDRNPKIGNARCPQLSDLVELADQAMYDDQGEYRTHVHQCIERGYTNFAKTFRMATFDDTADAVKKLRSITPNIYLLLPGSQQFFAPTIEYHGVDDFLTTYYLDGITPESLRIFMQSHQLVPEQTVLVGSSPSRELNAALTSNLSVTKIEYTNYITYDEAIFRAVPTVSSLYEFATILERIQ